MRKKQYIRPEMEVNQVESTQMIAVSGNLGRYEAPASPDLDALVNENNFTDIWGNKY